MRSSGTPSIETPMRCHSRTHGRPNGGLVASCGLEATRNMLGHKTLHKKRFADAQHDASQSRAGPK
jgi:hypothetical protein